VRERWLGAQDDGAGVGQYGHRLRSEDPDLLWTAYDGAGNVEEYTDGFVSWLDLTIPLSLPRADWVVSFDVGEHVPAPFEATVILLSSATRARAQLPWDHFVLGKTRPEWTLIRTSTTTRMHTS
jgi:hypothetical protein